MKILLCSYFKFPAGCAGAIRHEKIAQMLQYMGHDVFVVGLGKFNGFEIDNYNGISYTSLRYKSSGFVSKVRMRLDFWKNLKKIICDYNPDYIIMDDLRPYVTVKIKKYSNKNKIILIHDSVEWYSKEQFKAGVLSPSLINKNIVNRFLIDNKCRVIAISQYLTDYYKSKNLKCVNIPIVVSDDDLVSEKNLQEELNFVYAGQAGKKDYLHIILSAMEMLTDEERAKFKFHILGCTVNQILKNGVPEKTIKNIESSLVVHGRVPRHEVIETLKVADFTMLIRSEVQRYAKAGFPTKSVESLSHSTPMIANITSDLGRYLVDGYNSLIVPNSTPEALALTLKRAISLTKEQRTQMCKNAYTTASEKLHYNQFVNTLEQIMN